jgi:hypothetical protein
VERLRERFQIVFAVIPTRRRWTATRLADRIALTKGCQLETGNYTLPALPWDSYDCRWRQPVSRNTSRKGIQVQVALNHLASM